MPITPKFTLCQTDTHVKLVICVPHIRVSTDSIQVALTERNNRLHVAALPIYLLVLDFTDCGSGFSDAANEQCAEYAPTIENGTATLNLLKAQPGHWPNLDLVGQLVQPKPQNRTSKWLLEEQDGNDVKTHTARADSAEEDTTASGVDRRSVGYGFLHMFHDIFKDLTRDGLAKEMLEGGPITARPDTSTNDNNAIWKERRRQRMLCEKDKFDCDRYLQDLQIEEDYIFECAMTMRPHWTIAASELPASSIDNVTQQLKDLSVDIQSTERCPLTPAEQTQLTSIPYPLLPRPISQQEHNQLLYGLLDILFAYTYDHLLTDGEATVESAWTISILSASLSWLDDDWTDDSHKDNGILVSVLCSSIRRSLIYPYIRNFDFALHVCKHVATILQGQTRRIVRCLLQTRTILDHSELYYLGNKLYIDPYLRYLQRYSDEVDERCARLAKQIEFELESGGELKEKLDLSLSRREKKLQRFDEDEESSSSSDESESGSSSSFASSPSVGDNSGTAQGSGEIPEQLEENWKSMLKVTTNAEKVNTPVSTPRRLVQEID